MKLYISYSACRLYWAGRLHTADVPARLCSACGPLQPRFQMPWDLEALPHSRGRRSAYCQPSHSKSYGAYCLLKLSPRQKTSGQMVEHFFNTRDKNNCKSSGNLNANTKDARLSSESSEIFHIWKCICTYVLCWMAAEIHLWPYLFFWLLNEIGTHLLWIVLLKIISQYSY